VQKLLEKELIVISGRMEEMVGKPLIYSTSKSFMDYLGINTIDDLPKISEIKMDNQVEPTNAFEALPDTNIQMVVSVSGELLEMNQTDQNTYDTL
jgi:segregation and condensation protein B